MLRYLSYLLKLLYLLLLYLTCLENQCHWNRQISKQLTCLANTKDASLLKKEQLLISISSPKIEKAAPKRRRLSTVINKLPIYQSQ